MISWYSAQNQTSLKLDYEIEYIVEYLHTCLPIIPYQHQSDRSPAQHKEDTLPQSWYQPGINKTYSPPLSLELLSLGKHSHTTTELSQLVSDRLGMVVDE